MAAKALTAGGVLTGGGVAASRLQRTAKRSTPTTARRGLTRPVSAAIANPPVLSGKVSASCVSHNKHIERCTRNTDAAEDAPPPPRIIAGRAKNQSFQNLPFSMKRKKRGKKRELRARELLLPRESYHSPPHPSLPLPVSPLSRSIPSSPLYTSTDCLRRGGQNRLRRSH